MYEVEVLIRRRDAHPFRVTGVEAETRVKEIIESFLDAWGIPVPRSLKDTGLSLFVDRLAEDTKYQHDDEHCRIYAFRNP
jgi:hypothetical protein